MKGRPSTSRLTRGAIGKSPHKSPVKGKRRPVFREDDESDGSETEEEENRSVGKKSPSKSPVGGKRRPLSREDDESDGKEETENSPTARKSPRKNAYLNKMRENEAKASGSKSKKSNSKK